MVIIYIPKRKDTKKTWGEVSGIKSKLEIRNLKIYNSYMQGVTVIQLSKDYFLSESSIRKIIYKYKNK